MYQEHKYFGHFTRHNGSREDENSIHCDRERSRGKPRQIWEKHIADIFGAMTTAGTVGVDFASTFGQGRPEEDML